MGLRFTALVLLVGFLSTASAHEDTSPVQVYDLQKWLEIRDRAKASEAVMSTKAMIEIIYDRIISRPWEEKDYWVAVNKRWAWFRSQYCPSEITLCTLPRKLENDRQLGAIRDGFVNANNRRVINSQLEQVGLSLTPNLIFPVQLSSADSEKTNFSFRIATIEKLESGDVEETSLITNGDVIMSDILTYRMGFTPDMAKTYFAVDSQANGYIQADRIREAAMAMARTWKQVIQGYVSYTTVDASSLLLQSLKKELDGEFAATYDRLFSKLDPKQKDHLEHIARFQSEKARDRYPIEVYQWVAFDQLTRVAEVLATHYQNAKQTYQELHTVNQSLKALVSLQTQVSPRLVFYLAQRIWDLDDGGVLDQVVVKPVIGTYMLEHLKVVLEKDHYADLKQFERVSQLIDYKLLTDDHLYLETHHPDFYKRMKALDLLDADKLRAAPLEVQRQWLEEYMTKNESEVFPVGVIRLSAALILGLDARTARDLAEIIRKARLNRVGLES